MGLREKSTGQPCDKWAALALMFARSLQLHLTKKDVSLPDAVAAYWRGLDWQHKVKTVFLQ